jgi:hypothetical protein
VNKVRSMLVRIADCIGLFAAFEKERHIIKKRNESTSDSDDEGDDIDGDGGGDGDGGDGDGGDGDGDGGDGDGDGDDEMRESLDIYIDGCIGGSVDTASVEEVPMTPMLSGSTYDDAEVEVTRGTTTTSTVEGTRAVAEAEVEAEAEAEPIEPGTEATSALSPSASTTSSPRSTYQPPTRRLTELLHAG